jgi:recombination protein RecR
MSSSPALDALIDALTCLPGIGRKSAQRMALYLLEKNREGASTLAERLTAALERVGHCEQCRNFSDQPLCAICSSHKRNQRLLCIVETPADVLAIESAGSFDGRYFVLMGRLSPLDGIGPEQLGLDLLEQQMKSLAIDEIILATNPTMEGEITARYIADLAARQDIVTSRIAHGIPMGGELEFVDSSTLSQAFSGRQKIITAEKDHE